MKPKKEILPYYLGTGLKMQTCINIEGNPVIEELTIDYLKSMIDEPIGELPLLRTLDSITKPITVEGYNDGKSFVPIAELAKKFYINREYKVTHYIRPREQHDSYTINCCVENDDNRYFYYSVKKNNNLLEFRVIELLLKWHFNVFKLPTDQFIEIKD